MKRIPSLHVTKPVLIEALRSLLGEEQLAESFAEALLIACKGKSCNNRALLLSNKAEIKKASLYAENPSQYAYIFCKVLLNIRRNNHHKGVSLIEEGSTNWTTVKKIVPLIAEFAQETTLTFTNACKQYISWGNYLMGNRFALSKFQSLSTQILEVYFADKALDENPWQTETYRGIRHYSDKVYSRAGMIIEGLDENPLKMVEFMKAAEYCAKNRITITDYIDAQFEGLDWTGGIPEPTQLNSENAIQRYVKFAYKNKKHKPGKAPAPSNIEWDKIKTLENESR